MVTNLVKLKNGLCTRLRRIRREKIQRLGSNEYGYETRDQTTGIDVQQFQQAKYPKKVRPRPAESRNM
jgi:hypothetical protein